MPDDTNSNQVPIPDRRTFPRITGDHLEVILRRRGRLGRVRCEVLDFNRFGIAVLTLHPLLRQEKWGNQKNHGDQEIFVSLRHGETHVENVFGVVHTCFSQEDGFRSGIQFRTQSKLQFDKEQVEAALLRLEMGLMATIPAESDNRAPNVSHP